MVERKEGAERQDGARPSPITADVNSKLGAYTIARSRRRRSSRRWPFWLLILLLIAALAGLAYWGNQQREDFEKRLNELQGQLSNMHARFDSLDASNPVDSNILVKRIDSLAKAQEEFKALLQALGGSLNALEESGKAARDVLHAELGGQRQALEKLDERLRQGKERQSAQEAVGAALMMATRTHENQVEKQREMLDKLRMQQAQAHDMLESKFDERIARLDKQLKEQSGTLKELRQIQVALSAQLEMLQGNP